MTFSLKSFSLWTWIVVFSALAASLLTVTAHDAQLRVLVVLWFLLVCPGMMFVRYFRLSEAALEWVIAIALSLAVDALVAGILLYSGRWSPSGAFAIIAALTVAGAIAYDVYAVRAKRRITA